MDSKHFQKSGIKFQLCLTLLISSELMGLRQPSLSLAENAFCIGAKSEGCDFEC